MKINHSKRKMQAGEPAYGLFVGAGSALIAETLSNSGFDHVMIDMQHGSWGLDTAIAALTAISAGPAVPMARVPRNDYTWIGRLLDEGALGIIVPMVDTPADAKAAADACRFPPVGNRSWGWGRAANYGGDYSDWVNNEVFVAVQIESKQAVDNAEAILATPGVDGCWIGPSDLSLTLGVHPRDRNTSELTSKAIERVVQACKNTGKIPGIACSNVEEAMWRAGQGHRFLIAGGDLTLIGDGVAAGLKLLGRS